MSTRPEDLVHDDELFAFLLEDALEPARADAIRAALVRSPALAARLATISDAYERAFEAPERDDLFEARVWRRVAAKLGEQPAARTVTPRTAQRGARFALAATVLVALGVGFITGRVGREESLGPASVATSSPSPAGESSRRVLAMHLASHFESAERALLVAANSPDDAETARAIARDLVEGNRVYAAAAERAGRPQLADFLRQLEPVLLELANGTELSSDVVADRIRDRDLAFKTRAAAALARRELAPADERIDL